MSRSQAYRSQLIAQQNRRLLFCLLVAIGLHGGAIAAGMVKFPWLQLAKLDAEPTSPPPTPIEFVYVEAVKFLGQPVRVTPAEPDKLKDKVKELPKRTAQVDAIAGGKSEKQSPLQTGSSGNASIHAPIQLDAAKPGNQLRLKRQPPTSLAEPFNQSRARALAAVKGLPMASRASVPARSDLVDSALALPPKTAVLTQPKSPDVTVTQSASAQPPHLPPHLPPRLPIVPSPFSRLTASPVRVGDRTPETTIPQSGQGLSGTANSNRSTATTGTVDVQRDEIWSDYDAAMYRRIYENWVPRADRVIVDRTRLCIVRFVVDRQGQLQQVMITQSSGLETADHAALDAVKAAAPFARFPENAREQTYTRNQRFEYRQSE